MAENTKPMSFLQIGDETFEVIDEQAREDIDDIKDNALPSKANLTYVDGMKLVKIWENENPSQSMAAETDIDLGNIHHDEEIVIEYRTYGNYGATEFKHFNFKNASVSDGGTLSFVDIVNSNIFILARNFAYLTASGGVSHLVFDDCNKLTGSTAATDNSNMIPVAVYMVGDIYGEDDT